MTIKEIINTYTFDSITNTLLEIDCMLNFEDLIMFKKIHDILSMSSGIKRNESIAFTRIANQPFAVMKDEKNTKPLIAIISSIVNCEIYDEEGILSDSEMLVYLILHYIALKNGKMPNVLSD